MEKLGASPYLSRKGKPESVVQKSLSNNITRTNATIFQPFSLANDKRSPFGGKEMPEKTSLNSRNSRLLNVAHGRITAKNAYVSIIYLFIAYRYVKMLHTILFTCDVFVFWGNSEILNFLPQCPYVFVDFWSCLSGNYVCYLCNYTVHSSYLLNYMFSILWSVQSLFLCFGSERLRYFQSFTQINHHGTGTRS